MTIPSLVLLSALSAAPMVDVSPFAVSRAPDGSLEYSYDLSVLKLRSYPDAVAVHGDAAVQAFLKKLPRTTKLTVKPGTALDVAAGRGVESGRLAISFAATSEDAVASDNPLDEKKKNQLRPALDPRQPHVLLSADTVAWSMRELELSALAAEELDTEALRRELWALVLTRAQAKAKTSAADAREGALLLAARITAASACLDGARVPAAIRADADLSMAVDAELSRLVDSPDAVVAPAPWSWKPDLACAWVRMRALGQPFERSRAGTAAVLTFMEFLEKDPRLQTLFQKSRSRRDAFLGAPLAEPFDLWKQKANADAAAAIDNLNGFIESLPLDDRTPPGLIALPVTPFGRFLLELDGRERANAWAELTAAVADKRVVPGTDTFPQARDAALAPLCTSEGAKDLRFDGNVRDRFANTFTRLLGGSVENAGGGTPVEEDDAERSELRVRLLVPPALEVEPIPELFEKEALALERLVEALQREGLGGLTGLTADGQRTGPLVATARVWIPRLHGLAALATPDAPKSKDLAEGRRLAKDWRREPAFGKDVREATASPVSMSSSRQHAALVGVSRRELIVTFTRPPVVELPKTDLFTTGPSEQRYIVPVLVSVGGSAEPRRPPMDRKGLRALTDTADRDAVQVEGAFVEALRH